MKIVGAGVHPIFMILAIFTVMFWELKKLPFSVQDGLLSDMTLLVMQASIFSGIIAYLIVNFVIPSMLFLVLDHFLATKEEGK